MLHSYRELSWKEHSELPKDKIYAMLPIASIEQHGPHMSVGTDDLIIEYVLKRLANEQKIVPEIYVMPPVHYGLSPEHMNLCGTITLRSATLKAIVDDILSSLAQHGWKKLIILNSHGGNKGVIHGLAQEWKREYGLDIYIVETMHAIYDSYAETVMETHPSKEIHAGEDETSQMLYEFPDTVHMEELTEGFNKKTDSLPLRRDSWFTSEVNESGIIGGAHLATAEKGKKLTAYVCQSVIEQLNSLED